MDVVRPINRYPWPAIGSWACGLLPLSSALYFCPAWSGHWDPVFIEIWVSATLYTSAQCLPYYRWIALRGEASVERTLQQVLAVAFPALASLARWDVARLPADGRSTIDLLVHDKGAAICSAVIIASLALIVFGRRDRVRVSPAPT